MDPASMYWNDRKKYEKYVNKLYSSNDANGAGNEEEQSHSDSEEESNKKKKEKRKARKEAKKVVPQVQISEKPKVAPAKPIEDLIGFDSVPVVNKTLVDDFQDFQDGFG